MIVRAWGDSFLPEGIQGEFKLQQVLASGRFFSKKRSQGLGSAFFFGGSGSSSFLNADPGIRIQLLFKRIRIQLLKFFGKISKN